jgi:predicted transcriptional regulator
LVNSPSKAVPTLADKVTLSLFATIAESKCIDSAELKAINMLSKKAYYSRIENLIAAGLVKRKHGAFTLTMFGQVCYHACLQIEDAIIMYSSPQKREKKTIIG